MNTNESEFENQLRAVQPLAPSRALEESIARQLAPSRALANAGPRSGVIERRDLQMDAPGTVVRFFAGLRWAFCGAAAAAAVFLAANHFAQPKTNSAAPAVAAAAESDFEPVEVTRDLVAAEDGGLVFEDPEEPARMVRYTTLERHVWTHPVTGARLEVEIPREDVVLVPIAMQ